MPDLEAIKDRVYRKLPKKQGDVAAALGNIKADLVLKNATYLNVFSNEFCKGDIAVHNGLIVGIGESYEGETEIDVSGKIVSPGFIDAHIHLESSLVTPDEFARAVICHGTTTVITDPHEITNVMGKNGIRYMLEATEGLPIDVHFMLPSCVPAAPNDESGAEMGFEDIDEFYDNRRVLGLAEMMNYVGVINGDDAVLSKIIASQGHHKKIDGHAPDLSGKQLNAYIAAGVYSDHECFTAENALEKLRKGQFIMIREGTAAQNLDALLPLLTEKYYTRCMFATDDKHPNDLLNRGHIDYIVKKALDAGVDPVIAFKVATHEAARYFLMNNKGAIAGGYLADLIVIDNLKDFNIEMVFKKGKLVCKNGKVADFEAPHISDGLVIHAHNTFNVKKTTAETFKTNEALGVLGLIPGQLLTTDCGRADKINIENDIVKVAVLERHHGTGHIGIGYIKGYGMKKGAVATSIAHDSHNIIVVGASEEEMSLAVNRLIDNRGGIVVAEGDRIVGEVDLPVAGLISESPLAVVNENLENAKAKAFDLGVSRGIDPFMTLSFLSLSVIPTLRITTKGVFDVANWKFI